MTLLMVVVVVVVMVLAAAAAVWFLTCLSHCTRAFTLTVVDCSWNDS